VTPRFRSLLRNLKRIVQPSVSRWAINVCGFVCVLATLQTVKLEIFHQSLDCDMDGVAWWMSIALSDSSSGS